MSQDPWRAAAAPMPSTAGWGSQTDHHLRLFTVGHQRMPLEMIRAMAWVKWAAAQTNGDLRRLEPVKAQAIAQAAERVAAGEFDAAFPLSLWQGGAAANSNDNMNEVLAQIASQPPRGPQRLVQRIDPTADVDLGQQSGTVFVAAMQVAAALQAKARLLPALAALRATVATMAAAGNVGPGCIAALAQCDINLRHALLALCVLSLGTEPCAAPAAWSDFGARLTEHLAERLDLPLSHGDHPLAGHHALLPLHGALRALALVLARVSDHLPTATPDRAGDLQVLAMVCAQVVGHDAAIGFAASQSRPGLAVFEPLIAMNTLDSLRLLADAMTACSLQAPVASTNGSAGLLFRSVETGVTNGLTRPAARTPTPSMQPKTAR